MFSDSEVPCILISSSRDLRQERFELDNRLKLGLQAHGSLHRTLLWEEATEDGRSLSSKETVQRQIDELLAGQVQLTIVMFGECIGFPLRGELPINASAILEVWKPHGLVHPWPDKQEEKLKLLNSGNFPLTGTVYELLVAREKLTPGELIVGFVADCDITDDLSIDSITFNQGRRYNWGQKKPTQHDTFKSHDYDLQVKGLLNFLKALSSQENDRWIQRFKTPDDMFKILAKSALSILLPNIPNRSGQLPYKANMEHYTFDDPLPLPDRTALREKLKPLFLAHSKDGEMLVLEGPSGCGKSSLMQRGILGELPFEIVNAKVVVFRPTHLTNRNEGTILERLLGFLSEQLEQGEDGIVVPLGLRKPETSRILDIPRLAAEVLGEALDSADRSLALGVDQFEELIDLVAIDEMNRDSKGSWWQVLRFLASALGHKKVFIIGTLERMRRDSIEKLQLRGRTGLVVRRYNADFPISDVHDFVTSTAQQAQLGLSKNLIDDIYNMVNDFEAEKARSLYDRTSASFLPLLGIWLHRLFSRFRDRMLDATDGLSEQLGQATNKITRKDVQERGIQLTLAPMIGELMYAAWGEAGELGSFTLQIHDSNVVSKAVSNALQDPKFKQDVETFVQPNGSFDFDGFLAFALAEGWGIPGTRKVAQPGETNLSNFFSRFVAMDRQGKVRLIDAPDSSHIAAMQKLIKALLHRRLLVPTITGRVRLVHQATIDNWKPAQDWYNKEKSLLLSQRKVRYVLNDPIEFKVNPLGALQFQPDLLGDAVRVLQLKRATWADPKRDFELEQDLKLKKFCCDIVELAESGDESVEVAGHSVFLVAIAAMYNIDRALIRWLEKDPTLVTQRSGLSGATPLGYAAWGANKAVDVLLRFEAKPVEDNIGWHPISAAIQAGHMEIFTKLYSHYKSPLDIIGPQEISILHEAARASSPTVLNYLLQISEQTNPEDSYGSSPIHFAASEGRAEQIVALMHHCDRLAVNSAGDTALSVAISVGQSEVVTAILDHDALTDEEQLALLSGKGIMGAQEIPAIALAASFAQPYVLSVLLHRCTPKDALIRSSNGVHALALLTLNNHVEYGGAPLADRVADCAQLLLKHCPVDSEDVANALKGASDFPDTERLLKGWLVTNGKFDGVSDVDLINWLVGSQLNAALSVLRNAPRVLDIANEDGIRGGMLLLEKGLNEVIAIALHEGILPEYEPELFRFEAAMRLLNSGVALPKLAQKPHPLVAKFIDGEAQELKAVFEEIPPSKNIVWPLPHRLAMRNHKTAFVELVSSLSDGIPYDRYGRKPSDLAPPSLKASYILLEQEKLRLTQ